MFKISLTINKYYLAAYLAGKANKTTKGTPMNTNIIKTIAALVATAVLCLLPASLNAEEQKKTDITGYGDIILRETINKDEWRSISKLRKKTGGKTEYATSREETFYTDTLNADVTLFVFLIDSKVMSFTIKFENLLFDCESLTTIGNLVWDVRKLLLDTYDESLIGLDRFTHDSSGEYDYDSLYTGTLSLIDEEGDAILLDWDGYEVRLIYYSAEEIEMMALDNQLNQQEQKGKI